MTGASVAGSADRLVGVLSAMAEPVPDVVAGFGLRHITDTLAIASAASVTPAAADVVRAGLRGSAGGACGLIGAVPAAPATAPPATAAFVNSALAHMLDYDDIHDEARLHPTTVAFPAALAAAQTAGGDGRAVLRGTVTGAELMCRMGAAVAPTGSGPAAHWFLTQLLGYLGSSIAAGIALGLDHDGLVSALSLATMQAAGVKQVAASTGSTARSIYPAFAAAGGVSAALLAAEGMRGTPDALDGVDGLLPVYLGMSELPEPVLSDTKWRYPETAIKPWPCCRLAHPYVSAAATLAAEIGGAGIDRVEIAVNASAARLCRPEAERRTPATVLDAKYSIPFMVAHTLRHGGVDLVGTAPGFEADPAVRALAARVAVRENLPDGPGHPHARITAHTTGGGRYEVAADLTTLDATDAAAAAKVAGCLAFAGAADPKKAAADLSATVAGIPRLPHRELALLIG